MQSLPKSPERQKAREGPFFLFSPQGFSYLFFVFVFVFYLFIFLLWENLLWSFSYGQKNLLWSYASTRATKRSRTSHLGPNIWNIGPSAVCLWWICPIILFSPERLTWSKIETRKLSENDILLQEKLLENHNIRSSLFIKMMRHTCWFWDG